MQWCFQFISHPLISKQQKHNTNTTNAQNRNTTSTSSIKTTKETTSTISQTLDTQKDYTVINALLKWCESIGKKYDYNIDDIVYFFTNNKQYEAMNISVKQRSIPKKFSTKLKIFNG